MSCRSTLSKSAYIIFKRERAGRINKLFRTATYMLILSELHCNNSCPTYIHQFSIHFSIGIMTPRLRKVQQMHLELALHYGEPLASSFSLYIAKTGSKWL